MKTRGLTEYDYIYAKIIFDTYNRETAIYILYTLGYFKID